MKFSSHLWMTPLPLFMALPGRFVLSGKVKYRLDACVAKLSSGDPGREAGLV